MGAAPGSGPIMLKSVRSGYYLHVHSTQDPTHDNVMHQDSISEGSQWQVVIPTTAPHACLSVSSTGTVPETKIFR